MRLLLSYPVTLIVFAAITSATPPPGYVKRPNDDKDPPNYQYRYEIDNDNGKDIQGKMETRSGDSASGRYYVKGEKSSTEVKYYADEWGYHPVVKYRATNDHSVSTAHFAHGEHAVKSLLNGTEVGEEVNLPAFKSHYNQLHRQPLLQHRRRRPVQVIQPYTPDTSDVDAIGVALEEDAVSTNIHESRSIEGRGISSTNRDVASDVGSALNYDSQRTLLRNGGFNDAQSSTTDFHQNFNNFVTLPTPSSESISKPDQLLIDERERQRHVSVESTGSTPDYRSFARTNVYSTSSTTFGPSSAVKVNVHDENHLGGHETSNELFSTLSDDVLLVQNAGSFGRRLNPTAPTSIHGNSGRPNTPGKSGISPPPYEVSTLRPILRISDSTNGLIEHGGASSYGYYSSSTTTQRPTTLTYSTLTSNEPGNFAVTPTSDFHKVPNLVSAEISSNDYKNTATDVRYRENTANGAFAGIFAKIYPNGETVRATGESINSLAVGSSELSHYEAADRNENSTKKTDVVRTPGLSATGKRFDHQLYVTLRQSLDSELQDLPEVRSPTPSTLSTFSSMPIVVAELGNYKTDSGYEYSTTFPCNKDEDESSTIPPNISNVVSPFQDDGTKSGLVTPKLQSSRSYITTSSVILNPIQAGVRLVNAGETELIAIDDHTDRVSAPVSERIENESEVIAIKNVSSGHESGKIVTEEARSKLYETINPAFGQPAFGEEAIGESIGTDSPNAGNAKSDVALLDGNTEDQQIEIQKSVEIYQNAPVHEIHYPPQVIRQVSDIHHQQHYHHQQKQDEEQERQSVDGLLHQRDEAREEEQMQGSYVQLQDVENAKQFHSPLLVYNGEQEEKHESHGTRLSLENIREGPSDRVTAYLGNLVRHDNELVDYSIERNNAGPTLLSGPEDSVKIIQMIRENIPEVRYTTAKTPRINVKVYPMVVQTTDNEQLIMKQQDAADLLKQEEKVENKVEERAKTVQSQLQRLLTESGSVQRYFSDADWSRLQQEQHLKQLQQQLEQQLQQKQQQHLYQHQHQHQQQQHQQQQQELQQHQQQQQQQQQQQKLQHQQQKLQHQQQQQELQQQQQQHHHQQYQQQQQQQQQLYHQHQQQQQQQHPQQQEQQQHQSNLQHQLHQQAGDFQNIHEQYQVHEDAQKNHGQSQVHETVPNNQVQYQVHENVDVGRIQAPQQQPMILPWSQLYDAPGVKTLHVNTGNLVEEISSTSQALQRLHPPVTIGERIVEKTIHVPQPYPVEVPRIIEKKVPYPVEKIVERKVPYPVEKIIEKKVTVPQPYPVHIQVPVDRIVEKQVPIPYPVHIEKIIEKKVPYPVQKLVPQPYPVHIIQPYPVEKIVEKPIHIPVTVEKIVEKNVHVPQPYPVQVPIKVPYPVELTKYVEQSVHVPYGVHYGVSYQQIMKPQSSKGLYGNEGSVSVPLYGLSLVSNQNRGPERPNVTQNFPGYKYEKPEIPFVTGRAESPAGHQQRSNGWEQFAYGKATGVENHQRQQTFAKKSYAGNASKLPSLTHPHHNYSVLNRRHASYRQSHGSTNEHAFGKNEYSGPVPSTKQNSHQQTVRSRSPLDQQQQSLLKQHHSTAVTRAVSASASTSSTSSRHSRQQDATSHYQTGPGAFRQSKIEYGFKPPMVPSVQYDEKTATKVEK